MIRWGRFAGAYALVGGVALALIWPRGAPLLHPERRLSLDDASAHWLSLGIGLLFGTFLVVGSRITVQRFEWARRLHLELRPLAQGLPPAGIVVLAALSSVGEELLFRGLFQPWMGLWPQAILFGLLHQLPGPSRWIWVSWAFLVGLALGALFALTGSLLGPLAAHALVNGMNLSFLKSHDPGAMPVRGAEARA